MNVYVCMIVACSFWQKRCFHSVSYDNNVVFV